MLGEPVVHVFVVQQGGSSYLVAPTCAASSRFCILDAAVSGLKHSAVTTPSAEEPSAPPLRGPRAAGCGPPALLLLPLRWQHNGGSYAFTWGIRRMTRRAVVSGRGTAYWGCFCSLRTPYACKCVRRRVCVRRW